MKITWNDADQRKVLSLIQRKDENILAAEAFLCFLQNDAYSISKAKVIKKAMKHKVSDEQALGMLMKESIQKYGFSLDEVYFQGIKKLDASTYTTNPYYQHIHALPKQAKQWKLSEESYCPYQVFDYQEVRLQNPGFIEIPQLGYFDKPFSYLAVLENDTVWMSITPNEIETMQIAINEVEGHVVCYGLGLGYFAYMASLKPTVKCVTIVEKDPHVIALFTHDLLPQFDDKDKIEIVLSDAFTYAQHQLKEANADFAFVDLWHDPLDGLPMYLTMKSYENDAPNTRFLYWIESSMFTMLRRAIVTLVEEQLQGFGEMPQRPVQNPIDGILNRLSKYLKDYPLSTYDELVVLLQEHTLQKIAKELSQ
jgi:hypothetical protein